MLICEKNVNKPPTLGGKLGQQQDPVGNQPENKPKPKSEYARETQTEASTMYVESSTVVLLQTAQNLVGKVGSVMDHYIRLQLCLTRAVSDPIYQIS